MKKLLSLLLCLFLSTSAFAQDRLRVYPETGLISFQGLDDTSSPLLTQNGRASNLQNVVLDNIGDLSKRYGFSTKNINLDLIDTLFSSVTGLWELYKSNGVKYFIAVCGSKVFWDNSGTWSDITSLVNITDSQDNQFVWTTALDYAIGVNGVNPAIQWNGAGNCSNISFTGLTNPISKAKSVIWWKNYLIFANTTENSIAYPTRIRWSNVGTINTWSNDDYVDIATLGGQQVEAMAVLYDNLIIFLTDSIYKVSLVGGNELINVSKVSEGVGTIAKNSAQNIQIGNAEGLIFLSRDKTINFFDGVQVTDISFLIANTMDNLSSTRLPYAVSINDKVNGHYYLSVSDGSSSANNLILDYNYVIGEWSKHTNIETNVFTIADDNNSFPRVYFGNYKSFIYQMQDPNLNNDVAGLTGVLDGVNRVDTSTATGILVCYDNSFEDTYNVLLLHCNGDDASAIFIDEINHSITANGNAQIDTAQSKFGGASGLFDGSGDYLTASDSEDWNFGIGDFTIDFWIRFNGEPASSPTFIYNTNSGNGYMQLGKSGNNLIWNVFDNSQTQIVANSNSWIPLADTWYHIAAVRSGTSWMTFINGVKQSSVTTADVTYPNYDSTFGIGSLVAGNYTNGWIDECRVSKGIARWTENFTPPVIAHSSLSRFIGAKIDITSGAGKGESAIIVGTTTTGLVVENDSFTATGLSVYSIGAIDSYYISKWYSMENPFVRKNFKDFFVWADTDIATGIVVYCATDENSGILTVNNNSETTDGTLWGDSLNNSNVWSGESISLSRLPINASGRFLKIKFAEDEVDKTLDLAGYGWVYENLGL